MVAQGTTLAGRYRLDARLGAGGMGEVWRGEDTVLARTVAVKVLLPGRLDDPGFAVRFQGEARAMATVNHPGVVDVYDYGVTDVPGDGPTAYLVMRFVDGEPLDRLLMRLGRLGPEPAMELIAQAAAALQAVHDRGIVHRDIKPGNLLVRPDGTLVLTDFGIARADANSRLTDAGMVLGTAAYCAPEQAEGAPVTPAVDIYALGVVAYECVAGRRPFDGDTPVTIALKHIREEPPPLPADVPPAVRAVVERAMSKDPARRWPSAAAMSQAARQSVALGGAFDPGTAPATGGYGRQGMAAALDLGSASTQAEPAYPERPYADPAFTGEAPTYRVTRDTWSGGTAVPPATVEAPQPGSRSSRHQAVQKKRRSGLIVAGVAGSVVVVGLAALGVNLASAGSGRVGEPSTPPLTVETPSTPAHSPSRTPPRSSPTPTHTKSYVSHTPTPTPTRTPSPSPTPSDSPSPSPSPSDTANMLRVPLVRGLSEGAATAKLQKAGFRATVKYSGDGDCRSPVTGQSPASGALAAEKSVVRIFVLRKPCASPSPSATPSPSVSPTP
ncbi:serine/threonine-protein kinase [Planotetraspora sp. A-T 1434]|uniref:serine/threonine-protein kinase n=1 Tax=Planotetraspora sp. A-T 1434 TaxID=2979219 RepID=UPI0021C1208A|nr:serine/threonine-protein kinase [Planotetraspora sp. A-T 1434]MCT9931240.1 serine/threonine-protein kinase [Planotetraspora sp. A-T 1434]